MLIKKKICQKSESILICDFFNDEKIKILPYLKLELSTTYIAPIW